MTQLALDGADGAPPRLEDLAGLLAGPAQGVLRGPAARVSVVVTDAWRVDALRAELAALDLGTSTTLALDSAAVAVRTAFSERLHPLAAAWQRGGGKRAPAGLALTGGALRLWCLAAGRATDAGYLLRLGAHDEPVWAPVGSALAAAGVAAVFVGARAEGPAYRVTGRRRLARLAELVGQPPPGVPGDAWPAGPRPGWH